MSKYLNKLNETKKLTCSQVMKKQSNMFAELISMTPDTVWLSIGDQDVMLSEGGRAARNGDEGSCGSGERIEAF